MSIKVTIITPCLNSEKTIRNTIESVLKQTYENIEYIIVDGASSDGTISIVEEYIPLFHGRMRYVSEKDNGIYDAMNKGIIQASGDVIGIINSDDWYEQDAVEQAVKCFEGTDADVVYGEMWLVDQNGDRAYHTWHSTFPPHPGTFVKKETYQKYGMFETEYRIAADRELLLRFMAAGIHFEHINEIFANFRRTGISNTKILECAEETYEIDLKYWGKCPECLSRDAIEEKYEREKLLYISQIHSQIIWEIFKEKNFDLDAVAIFGVGNCGKELLKILEECGVSARLFVDNDISKWGLEYHGIKIYSPEILRNFSGHVIVTVTKFQRDICEQLQNYGNPALNWETLDEIRKRAICIYDSFHKSKNK